MKCEMCGEELPSMLPSLDHPLAEGLMLPGMDHWLKKIGGVWQVICRKPTETK